MVEWRVYIVGAESGEPKGIRQVDPARLRLVQNGGSAGSALGRMRWLRNSQ
jgi:hypothetical protein